MAILGGTMLVALIMLTCGSIAGRGLGGLLQDDVVWAVFRDPARWLLNLGVGPILGDYELVEAGVAFAVFSFLPLCQISGSHASVDVFVSRLPERWLRALQAVTDTLFAVVLSIIAVQLTAGMLSKQDGGQLSFLLQFPVWWGYAVCLPSAVLAALVAGFVASVRWVELASGRTVLSRTGTIQ